LRTPRHYDLYNPWHVKHDYHDDGGNDEYDCTRADLHR